MTSATRTNGRCRGSHDDQRKQQALWCEEFVELEAEKSRVAERSRVERSRVVVAEERMAEENSRVVVVAEERMAVVVAWVVG
jgi:hypothetical protein